MKVMIVEDQTMIRSLLESYFRAEDGYRITASIPGAKQAVEMCRTNSVDLILMDVQTENRENGLIAVRQNIGDFAFSFVAPAGADNCFYHNSSSLSNIYFIYLFPPKAV